MATQNKTNTYLWKIDKYNGGEAEDSRIGPPGSARYLIGFDIHEDTGKLVVARKPVKQSASIVTKLIKWIEYVQSSGKTYFYGEDTIYQETGGSYSVVRTILSGTPNGQGMALFNGYLYYRTATTLGRYDLDATWNDSYQTGLQAVTTFCPMKTFKNLMLVGNGRYLGTLDDVGTWNPTRLTFPVGYYVKALSVAGSLAVILISKGTAITDSNEGYLVFWNGTSQTYDSLIPIDGNPHAVAVRNNRIYIIAGTPPVIQQSLGGVAEDLFTIPNVGIGKTAEVYPGAIDVWNKKIYYGISDGTSTSVLRVVRSWGSKNAAFPEVSNPEFPTSQADVENDDGLTGTTVQITALKQIGTTIRYAWKSGSSYGVDVVDTTQYQACGILRSLAFDRESPYEKLPDHTICELVNDIQGGETVRIRVGFNPYGDEAFAIQSDYIEKIENTEGNRLVRVPMNISSVSSPRSRDLHVEILVKGDGDTRPEVKRLWTRFDEESDTL